MTKWYDKLLKMRVELEDNSKKLEKLNGYSRIYKIYDYLLDSISKYKIFMDMVDKVLEGWNILA